MQPGTVRPLSGAALLHTAATWSSNAQRVISAALEKLYTGCVFLQCLGAISPAMQSFGVLRPKVSATPPAGSRNDFTQQGAGQMGP